MEHTAHSFVQNYMVNELVILRKCIMATSFIADMLDTVCHLNPHTRSDSRFSEPLISVLFVTVIGSLLI